MGGEDSQSILNDKVKLQSPVTCTHVMNQHAADNKHNYHTIYYHIPLGARTVMQSLHLRVSGVEFTLESLL